MKTINKRYIGVLIISIAVAVFIASPYKLSVILTDSVQKSFAIWKPLTASDVLRQGDFVVFSGIADSHVRLNKNEMLIKQISCTESQYIFLNSDGAMCDKKQFLQHDDFISAYPQYNLQEIIPDNFFFVTGTHPKSYDSRYFGLISRNQIKGKALWLF